MMDSGPEPQDGAPTPVEQVHDDQGVDRSQIRAFLALSPRERLDRASQSASFFLRVRALNVRPQAK
jgi:hypothetical protein